MLRNLPNFLSLLRLLMAPFILVLPKNLLFPFFCLAALTDVLDGFLARKLRAFSKLGLILDPLADKVFSLFCAYLFFTQGSLTPFGLLALFSRDVSLLLFALWLTITNCWGKWSIQSFFCGKVSTSLQVIVFSLLALNLAVPELLFFTLLSFGVFSFFELAVKAKNLE